MFDYRVSKGTDLQAEHFKQLAHRREANASVILDVQCQSKAYEKRTREGSRSNYEGVESPRLKP